MDRYVSFINNSVNERTCQSGSTPFYYVISLFFISCSDIQKLLAELLCHCIDLCHILIAEGGHDLYIVLKPCDIFALLEHSFHDFGCSRCPASVLNEADGSVLVITLCQVLDECTHKREGFSVVCNAGQYQLAVAESVFHCLCHVFSCKIADNNLRAALFFQLLCKKLCCFLCMSVYRCVGDHYAFALYFIRRPDIIFLQIMSKIFGKDRSVKRADGLEFRRLPIC